MACGVEEEVEEEGAGKEQAYGEAQDDAICAESERKGYDVGGRDAYHDVAEKCYPYHGGDMFGASERACEVDLGGVAELV